jgi:hypothetical protein
VALNSLKRVIAGLLCVMTSVLPVLGEPQAAAQQAGQISALIPAATRNAKVAQVNEELDWNDLLKTAHTGRVRAGLTDGSILSVGTDSELRIVQHDGASQQTSLEMDFGKVRSQVTKITKPGGKFEMKTPNAVIGVIGTDFYAAYEKNRTTVICYEGRVSVTPIGQVQVVRNSGQTGSTNNPINVSAGQMVVITSVIPPGGFQTADTPPGLQQNTLLATDVPTSLPPNEGPGHAGHTGRNVFIGSAVAVGIAVGVLASRGSNNCKPTVGVKGNCP